MVFITISAPVTNAAEVLTMSRQVTKVFIWAVFVIGLLWLTPVVWKPWVSAEYATQRWVGDDGKGFVFWLEDAAKFWGYRTYEPLYDLTHQYEKLDKGLVVFTLLDIISSDKKENVAKINNKLLDANSTNARMLGYFASVTHQLPVSDANARAAEIRAVIDQQADASNQTQVELAIRVAGDTRISDVASFIGKHLNRRDVPYGVRVVACKALEKVPEKDQAFELLTAAIKRPIFYARVECAEALSKLAGSSVGAIAAIQEAIRIEADEAQRRRLKNVLANAASHESLGSP